MGHTDDDRTELRGTADHAPPAHARRDSDDMQSAKDGPTTNDGDQAVTQTTLVDAGTSPYITSDAPRTTNNSTMVSHDVATGTDHSARSPDAHLAPPPHHAAPPPPPQDLSQTSTAAFSGPRGLNHRPRDPTARVHRLDKPRRAHLDLCGLRTLTTCPSTKRKRGRKRKTRRAPAAQPQTPSQPAPIKPLTQLAHKASSTRWPEHTLPTANPQAPPPQPSRSSHSRQRPNAATNGSTCPRQRPQCHTEKYDRHVRSLLTQPRPQGPMHSPITLQHGQTTPHFGGMTSSRLGKGQGSSSGTQDPCHCHRWTAPDQQGALTALQDTLSKAAHRMSMKGPRVSTILPLLQDMAMLTMNWAWDTNTWLGSTDHLCAIMAVLADRDPREDDISPISDTSPRPKQQPGETLPLHVASKGIGAAGSIPINPEVWNKHLPCDMKRALLVAPDLGDSDDKALAVWAHAMHRDGLLIRCHHGTAANMRAFPKPKSQEKGALIADLRLLNALMGKPPRPFELPSMAQLAALLELLKAHNVKAFFTKLDVSNMFWSVLLPPEHSTSFRFRVQGVTYAIPSLPFGWTASPSMAVEVLAAYLTLHFPGEVILIQHVDDVLLFSADRERLRLETSLLTDELRAAGWIISAKSQVEPTAHITWMGKHLDGS